MIILKNNNTGEIIGELSEFQLKFLIDDLEEEGINDHDYWLHISQVEQFEKRGIDPDLVSLLKKALDGKQEVEILWERK